MRKRSRERSSQEFGKAPSSGSQMAGMDAPMIGAASAIKVDAMVENESGKTPSPPPVSPRAIVIALLVVFVVALGLVLFLHFGLHVPLSHY